MRYYTNDCCDCDLPCIFSACSCYKVEHFQCDLCGEIDVKLYHYDDTEICEDCLLREFDVVEGSNGW